MTTEYTPDELSVEIAYVYADEYDTLTYEERRKAFHRWLNEERAKAWDRGQLNGEIYLNPYRKETP